MIHAYIKQQKYELKDSVNRLQTSDNCTSGGSQILLWNDTDTQTHCDNPYPQLTTHTDTAWDNPDPPHIHTHVYHLSRTTQVSQYQKIKPIWILLKQETVSGSGISWAMFKSAPRSRQITKPAPNHSVFSCRPTNSIKALKATYPHTHAHTGITQSNRITRHRQIWIIQTHN